MQQLLTEQRHRHDAELAALREEMERLTGSSAEWSKERRALQAELAALREQLEALKLQQSAVKAPSARPPPSEAPKGQPSKKGSTYGKGSVRWPEGQRGWKAGRRRGKGSGLAGKIYVREGERVRRAQVLGKIDLEEDASVVEQLKMALDKNQTKVLDLFREWDADGDGNVSRKEFAKAMPVSPRPDAVAAHPWLLGATASADRYAAESAWRCVPPAPWRPRTCSPRRFLGWMPPRRRSTLSSTNSTQTAQVLSATQSSRRCYASLLLSLPPLLPRRRRAS